MVVLTTVFALLIAPLIVILTHCPTAHATAALAATEMAAHGNHHDHHHSHAHEDAGRDWLAGVFGAHNPADHDHQFHALICQPASAAERFADKAHCALNDAFRYLTLDGPMRPPRFV